MPPPAKNVRLYRNGDAYFHGRKFVINRRQINSMDSFLEYATEGLKPPFGAVRNIYTPDGGTRVENLDALQSGRSYVAGGSEGFRDLKTKRGMKYQEIGTRKPPTIKKTYSHIKPVTHNAAYKVNGRWRQVAEEINQPIQLWLHVNGDSISSPVKLLLPSRILKLRWDMILEYVTERVGIRLGRAVRKLHTIDGEPIEGVKGLKSGYTYIACGSERFRKLPYRSGGQTSSAPTVLKRAPLPPIRRKNRRTRSPDNAGKQEYDNIVDKMMKDKKGGMGAAVGTQDVFQGKAVKVKSKGKKGTVDEDPNMKVEIPVELQKAKPVAEKKKKK